MNCIMYKNSSPLTELLSKSETLGVRVVAARTSGKPRAQSPEEKEDF